MKATPIILIIGAGAVGYYFYNKNKTAKAKAEQPDSNVKKAPVKRAPVKRAPAKKLAVKINKQNVDRFKAIAKKYATKENVTKALKVLRKK